MNWRAAGLLAIASAMQPALAWNDFGHMVVAAVAYRRLTPQARAESMRLLRLNPDYPQWARGEPAGLRDEVAFMRAATWPDAIKHFPGYIDDGERPSGPDAGRNTGYADHLQHRYWHFIDIPFSPDGTPLPPIPAPNAVTQIDVFRRVLHDPGADSALKSYDLVWLLHLVGDLHQPLHAVSRFTRELPGGDAGGNRVRLCRPPCREELHAFWDAAAGSARSPEAALRLARQLPAAPAAAAAADPADWARESVRVAERQVYPALGPGPGPYHLTPAYRARARLIAQQRLALAGARLARLLNAAFRRPAAPRATR
ncbi:MAG TPA: S1/P1 nuclease [Steroidobacteraceae bacterium]|nr:S1/P1 nuclease [Steroidobacteraceae bacterium]